MVYFYICGYDEMRVPREIAGSASAILATGKVYDERIDAPRHERRGDAFPITEIEQSEYGFARNRG